MLRRWIAAVLLSALSTLPGATCAPEPSDDLWYLPTTEGSQWVYQLSDIEDALLTLTLTSVETHKDRVIVEIGTELLGRIRTIKTMAVFPGALLEISPGSAPPAWELREGGKKGTKWESTERHFRSDVTVVYSAEGAETIEVPAGRFRAVRIDAVYEYRGVRIRRSRWYAPGIGLVKETGAGLELQLKSFTRGKQ